MQFFFALVQSSLLLLTGALIMIFGVVGIVASAGESEGPTVVLVLVGVVCAGLIGLTLINRGMRVAEKAQRQRDD
jgi:arginine exporter protein ArgO